MRSLSPTLIPVDGASRIGRISALFLSLLLILLLLGGCSGKDGDGTAADSTSGDEETVAEADEDDGDGDGEETSEAKPKKEKAIKVNVGTIRRGELVLPVYADGAIRTLKTVGIKTKVGGQLMKVHVRDGDRVRKGQILAKIDPREYEIALEESRYRHLQALSQMAVEADTLTMNREALTNFTTGRDELQKQMDRGVLSRDEFQARILELEMNALQDGAFREAVFQQRTGLADARMAENRARLNLEYTDIRAPFSGIVQGLTMVEGEIVAVNSPVCFIVNNEELEAMVNVLEGDLGQLTEGRPVLLAIAATGDTLQAEVDVISPILDETTRTCQIIIRFSNPDGRYRPGMFVRAQIAGYVYPDMLLAPKDALLIRDNRPLVFKREGDRARWLYVDVGLQNDSWIEILKVHSGGSLAAGDEVVVSDHLTLAHEAKISVRKTIPPSDRWDFATERMKELAAGDGK